MADERTRSRSPAVNLSAGDADWLVRSQGRESGPFTFDELKAKAAAGAIGPDDLVRNRHCSWAPAKQWQCFVFNLPGTPIPPAAAQQPTADNGAIPPNQQASPWAVRVGVMAVLGFVLLVGLLASQGGPAKNPGRHSDAFAQGKHFDAPAAVVVPQTKPGAGVAADQATGRTDYLSQWASASAPAPPPPPPANQATAKKPAGHTDDKPPSQFSARPAEAKASPAPAVKANPEQPTSVTAGSFDYSRYYDYNYRPPVGEHYVQGYYRRDGTFVSGHYQTNPDDSFWNNWSSQGNVNPHTGQVGGKRPPTGASGHSRRR